MLACGGGGSQPTSPVLSLSADQAAMTSVETTWGSAQGKGLSLKDQANAVLAAMQANPQFVASGISSDNTAWGRFEDGVTFAVATNDTDLEGVTLVPSVARVMTRPAMPRVSAASAPVAGELPGAANAYVFNAVEVARGVPATAVASNLRAAGYSVVAGTGLLTEWLTVNDAGVLFSCSHGGNVTIPGFGETYFVSSGQTFSAGDTLASLVAPLSQGHLVVWDLTIIDAPWNPTGPNPSHMEKHFGFDSHWLTTFGSPRMFAKNSMMLLEACDGMSPSGLQFGTALGQSCGLSLYGGWSLPVHTSDGNETTSFYFDRALGLNQFAPIDPSGPPPANWASILVTMGSTARASGQGYDLNQSDEGSLGISLFSFVPITPPGSSLTTIIPSIASNSLDSTNDVVTLLGSFGSDQGSVTLNGTPLTVKSWTDGTITVAPPSTTGNLQVLSPASLKSNLSPYNGNPWIGTWVGSITSTCGYYSGPLTYTITSTGGSGLLFTLSGGFNSYAGTYSGNSAISDNGAVTFSLNGQTMTAVEVDSCQTGAFTKQ